MELKLKQMKKQTKIALGIGISVLALGGIYIGTSVFNKPVQVSVVQETTTETTVNVALKQATDLVVDLENNPMLEKVEQVSVTIDGLVDSAEKESLRKRVGVVSEQLQRIALDKAEAERVTLEQAKQQESIQASVAQAEQEKDRAKQHVAVQTQPKAVQQYNTQPASQSTIKRSNTQAVVQQEAPISKQKHISEMTPDELKAHGEAWMKQASIDVEKASKEGLSDAAKRALGIPVTNKN